MWPAWGYGLWLGTFACWCGRSARTGAALPRTYPPHSRIEGESERDGRAQSGACQAVAQAWASLDRETNRGHGQNPTGPREAGCLARRERSAASPHEPACSQAAAAGSRAHVVRMTPASAAFSMWTESDRSERGSARAKRSPQPASCSQVAATQAARLARARCG